MGEFKVMKELIKALTYIGDAIEGEDSKEAYVVNDDANYLLNFDGDYMLINKNLDSTKLAFGYEEVLNEIVPTKVGDIFTQEGVDIINSMLSNELIKTHKINVFVFFKDTQEGDLLINIVSLRFKNDINKYTIIYGSNVITGSTSDKFTLDTPMYSNGIQ